MKNSEFKTTEMTNIDKEISGLLSAIRTSCPIVHCITNMVTVNDCANALLAIGASPIMAHDIREVEEITAGSDALICNFGATEYYDAMFLAAREARKKGHPVVVDPVGISGSTFRREQVQVFLDEIGADCIRGNYDEIHALITGKSGRTGVDAQALSDTDGDSEKLLAQEMKSFAKKYNTLLIASGAEDLITDGNSFYAVADGDPMMRNITGSGCMSSALLGAFLSQQNDIKSAAACCKFIGISGSLAAAKTAELHGGTMTFRTQFIDYLGMGSISG